MQHLAAQMAIFSRASSAPGSTAMTRKQWQSGLF